ncbi:MAG TPA: methylisocitrate lyase [Rectinemataceae bacterium]
MKGSSAGAKFRQALELERPLQIMGVINAYAARMASSLGFRALYLSGAGVANYSYALPDLGITCLEDVLADVRRVTEAVDLPLLVDIDTGWGGALTIARSIRKMTDAGAAAVHIEDQVAQKRCGHRPGKAVVSAGEMVERLKAAADAKTDPDFLIMARTDAFQSEGLSGVVDRACAYLEAGAEAIFAEALPDLEAFRSVCAAVPGPVLANMTEFGLSPLCGLEELKEAGVAMVLYPLTAARAMQKAAFDAMRTVRETGSQVSILGSMQTRKELYDFLDYSAYEAAQDRALGKTT